MPRGNGSYLGQTVSPNSNAASGIWTVREAEAYLRADKWPAQPTVPSAPTGTAGDGQVALTWTAPTGGLTPTDYIVQYSSNGGSSWTTFSDGVSTATSATVTGLTNGTGYIFRVIAVNALGQGPAGSASGTITPAALDVALLLHFNGSNGSTTFTDSSPNNASVTAHGNAQISTAESKFGGASGYFDGNGDRISLSRAGDWDGDFTVEFWLNRNGEGTGAVAAVFAAGGISFAAAGLFVYTTPAGVIGANNALAVGLEGGSATFGHWVHVAVVRSSGTNTLYVDGVSVATGSQTFPVTNSTIEVGGSIGYGWYSDAYIDELRIVFGQAIYTANFTPPTAPF